MHLPHVLKMNITDNEYIVMFTNELALINESMQYVAQVISVPAILDRIKIIKIKVRIRD